jgi:hypothetical protein
MRAADKRYYELTAGAAKSTVQTEPLLIRAEKRERVEEDLNFADYSLAQREKRKFCAPAAKIKYQGDLPLSVNSVVRSQQYVFVGVV